MKSRRALVVISIDLRPLEAQTAYPLNETCVSNRKTYDYAPGGVDSRFASARGNQPPKHAGRGRTVFRGRFAVSSASETNSAIACTRRTRLDVITSRRHERNDKTREERDRLHGEPFRGRVAEDTSEIAIGRRTVTVGRTSTGRFLMDFCFFALCFNSTSRCSKTRRKSNMISCTIECLELFRIVFLVILIRIDWRNAIRSSYH